MSVERLYALLQTGMGKDLNNRQLIFPSMMFTCSGEIVKWIMAGKWNNQDNRNQYPELQIWRSSGESTYQKQNSTVISVTSQEVDGVYEFPVTPPLPFLPGDILGLRQPHKGVSRLQVRYDIGGDSVYYSTGANKNNYVFNISGSGFMTTGVPLVTVSNTTDNVETPIMTSVKNTIDDTAGGDSRPMTTTTDATEPTSPPQVYRLESGGLETAAVVGLVLGLIILLLLAAITATLFLFFFHKKRHRKQENSGLDNPNYGKLSPTQLSKIIMSFFQLGWIL